VRGGEREKTSAWHSDRHADAPRGLERRIRLSPIAGGKCNFASRWLLCVIQNASNGRGIRRGILPSEERGDAKLHRLSPRRHPPQPVISPYGSRGGREGVTRRLHAQIQVWPATGRRRASSSTTARTGASPPPLRRLRALRGFAASRRMRAGRQQQAEEGGSSATQDGT
jgi:hypothetical protein